MNEPRKIELDDGARWMRAVSAMPDFDTKRTTVEANAITARWWRLMLRRTVLWLRRATWLRKGGESAVLAESVFGRSGKQGRGVPEAAIVGKARTARQRRPQPDQDDQTGMHEDRRGAALEKVGKICTDAVPKTERS